MTALPLAASSSGGAIESVGSPILWTVTIAAVVGLLALDFVLTRKPHAVSMKEATGWSIFYVALPLAFGVYIWQQFGGQIGLEYYTGYLVEKSLSVDNLFVFMLLLTAFAVPSELQQRVLLYGIIGALVLRSIFIALGAAALSYFDAVFLVFGAILLLTGVKLLKDAVKGEEETMDVNEVKSVKFIKRFFPVTEDYEGPKLFGKVDGKRALTPLALVVVAVFGVDIVFAIDSVPAVYGITGDPFLVFATNAFALLGLRALYFVLEGALSKLVHLSYGLSAILLFIGVKLVLHWGHLTWPSVPEIPTLVSLLVVVGILVLVTITSLIANKRAHGKGDDTDSSTPSESEAAGAS
ncbi:TerC family protein [Nocardioides marmoraquaticus]